MRELIHFEEMRELSNVSRSRKSGTSIRHPVERFPKEVTGGSEFPEDSIVAKPIVGIRMIERVVAAGEIRLIGQVRTAWKIVNASVNEAKFEIAVGCALLLVISCQHVVMDRKQIPSRRFQNIDFENVEIPE